MTLLGYEDLLAELDEVDPEKRLVVMPLLERDSVGPGSVDLRLGTEFIEVVRHEERALDPLRDGGDAATLKTRQLSVPLGEHLVLHPGQFVLGATFEFLRIPLHLAGQLLGRSSWARLGLIVATAVVVQPGFAGCLTLELVNMGTMPLPLYPGLRIAQLAVWRLQTPTSKPYLDDEAKYRAPLGPQSSRLGWESKELDRLRSIGKSLGGASFE